MQIVHIHGHTCMHEWLADGLMESLCRHAGDDEHTHLSILLLAYSTTYLYRIVEKQWQEATDWLGSNLQRLAICFWWPRCNPRRQLYLLGVAAWCSSLSELVKSLIKHLQNCGAVSDASIVCVHKYSPNIFIMQSYYRFCVMDRHTRMHRGHMYLLHFQNHLWLTGFGGWTF